MYERLKQICKEKGTTVTELCAQATGSSGNLATWKKGYMRSDYLLNCARILGVSTDYILGIERGMTNMKNRITFYDYLLKKVIETENIKLAFEKCTLCDRNFEFLKKGFYPSPETESHLLNELGIYLDSNVLLDDTYRLTYDEEKMIASLSTIEKEKQNFVTSFILEIENMDIKDIWKTVNLDAQEKGIIEAYRSTTDNGRNEMLHKVFEIRDQEKKISTDSTEVVAN